MIRRDLKAILALAILCAVGPAIAQEASQETAPATPPAIDRDALLGPPAGPPLTGDELLERTEEVALLMRCPVCQGLSIADSPTLLAQAMKAEVQEFLAEGYSEEQVMLYFEQSYGEFIRLEPKAKGFNLLVWLAPVAALVIGAWFVIARGKAPKKVVEKARDEETTDPEIETYRARVRQELGLATDDESKKEASA